MVIEESLSWPYKISTAAISHPGLSGRTNEDAFLDIEGPRAGADMHVVKNYCRDVGYSWLVAVADGMGGANAGEIASLMVVEQLFTHFKGGYDDITLVLHEIHRRIIKSSRENPICSGMGAAVAGIGAAREGIFVFNVGDCSVYRVVHGFLQRLTVDDSIANMLAMPGTISDSPRLQGQNRLTQVLGGPDSGRMLETHVASVRLKSSARFLLCSDGLTDMVTLSAMEALVEEGTASDVVQSLLTAALAAGGVDNITVMVLDLSLKKGNEPHL